MKWLTVEPVPTPTMLPFDHVVEGGVGGGFLEFVLGHVRVQGVEGGRGGGRQTRPWKGCTQTVSPGCTAVQSSGSTTKQSASDIERSTPEPWAPASATDRLVAAALQAAAQVFDAAGLLAQREAGAHREALGARAAG